MRGIQIACDYESLVYVQIARISRFVTHAIDHIHHIFQRVNSGYRNGGADCARAGRCADARDDDYETVGSSKEALYV
ncbi:hypothetical protein BHM03_00052625 [Ensete ventricosum]|nr:hypothetical protein BHM03_00052625 [Ensete ventricosum]